MMSVETAPAARFQSALASPLPGVSAEAWARLVAALSVQPIKAISASGGYGSYDFRARRLVELGIGENLRYVQAQNGRHVHVCDFVAPMTRVGFLTNPVSQYDALCRSMVKYHADLMSGQIARPEGCSVSGALAILHRGGLGALRGYPTLFDDTRALYEAARGAF